MYHPSFRLIISVYTIFFVIAIVFHKKIRKHLTGGNFHLTIDNIYIIINIYEMHGELIFRMYSICSAAESVINVTDP